MQKQKWELKRLLVPVEVDVNNKSQPNIWFNPIWNEKTKKSFAEADALAANGWELIGVIPEIGGHEIIHPNNSAGCSFTTGYLLMFKRQISA